MAKPRIFIGSSGKQDKLLQALVRGLGDCANVEPWTNSFNPGVSTLERLLELTRDVDFAAFVFAEDDWTTSGTASPPEASGGEASPRDNVVFEAGLFGGVLGMRRTFILHANGAKLPTDLLGLTCVRYDSQMASSEMRSVNAKLRKAIEDEGRLSRIEGQWWQFSLTARTEEEPAALGLLSIERNRSGLLELTGRAWGGDGRLCTTFRSEAVREKEHPAGLFYYFKAERPLQPDTPQLHGTGEIVLETEDRGSGYWTTRSDLDRSLNARTVGIYWRAEPGDLAIMVGRDDQRRAALIEEKLKEWETARNG